MDLLHPHSTQKQDVSYVYDAVFDTQLDLLKWYIRKGFVVNNNHETEFSPLHAACAQRYALNSDWITPRESCEFIECLNNAGADWSKRDRRGMLPVHALATTNLVEVAEFVYSLLEHPPRSSRDNSGRTPLHYAAHFRHVDMFNFLAEHDTNGVGTISMNCLSKDCYGYTPFHTAAKAGSWGIIEHWNQEFRQVGVVACLRDWWDGLIMAKNNSIRGYTLLDAASVGCRKQLVYQLLQIDPLSPEETIQVVNKGRVNSGEDTVDGSVVRGESMLFIACREGRRSRVCSFIDFMVQLGASVDTRDKHGNTLMHAVVGAKTERTPLSEIGSLTAEDGGGMCSPIIQKLESLKPGIFLLRNNTGESPLGVAVYEGNVFAVAALLNLVGHQEFHQVQQFTLEQYVNAVGVNRDLMLSGSTTLQMVIERHIALVADTEQFIHDRFLIIAEMLIGVGADVTPRILLMVKSIERHDLTNSITDRIIRLVTICPIALHHGGGPLASMPMEILQLISSGAMKDHLLIERLEDGNAPPSSDSRDGSSVDEDSSTSSDLG